MDETEAIGLSPVLRTLPISLHFFSLHTYIYIFIFIYLYLKLKGKLLKFCFLKKKNLYLK